MSARPRNVNLSRKASKAAQAAGIYQEAIKGAIREIVANPLLGTPLQGKLKPLRRVRVGPYRIVYYFTDTSIEVANIALRKDVYR